MISVEKIYEGVRDEGVNYGLPMTFLKLGEGTPYPSVDELVKELVVHTRCKWVCIVGKDTTQVGMGSLIKGLASMGIYLEVECPGDTRDPGWLHSVDRWIVDFVPDFSFNIAALRSADMVRFSVKTKSDLSTVRDGFEQLRTFPGTRYVRMDRMTAEELYSSVFEITRKYERGRMYRC